MRIYLKQMVQLRKQLLSASKVGEVMKKGDIVSYESGYGVFNGVIVDVTETGNLVVKTDLDDLICLNPADVLKGGDGESQDSSLAEGTGNK